MKYARHIPSTSARILVTLKIATVAKMVSVLGKNELSICKIVTSNIPIPPGAPGVTKPKSQAKLKEPINVKKLSNDTGINDIKAKIKPCALSKINTTSPNIINPGYCLI